MDDNQDNARVVVVVDSHDMVAEVDAAAVEPAVEELVLATAVAVVVAVAAAVAVAVQEIERLVVVKHSTLVFVVEMEVVAARRIFLK